MMVIMRRRMVRRSGSPALGTRRSLQSSSDRHPPHRPAPLFDPLRE